MLQCYKLTSNENPINFLYKIWARTLQALCNLHLRFLGGILSPRPFKNDDH